MRKCSPPFAAGNKLKTFMPHRRSKSADSGRKKRAKKRPEILPAHRKILDAARELFAAHGFADATVRAIAEKAGVNVAAINYYFRSKAQLYEAVYKDAFSSSDTGLDNLADGVKDEASWRAAVDAWVGRILYFFLSEDDPEIVTLRRLLIRERSMPTPYCASLLDSFIMPILTVLRSLVYMAMPEKSVAEKQAVFVSFLGQCTCFLDREKPWDKIFICPSQTSAEWIETMRAQITANFFARLRYVKK